MDDLNNVAPEFMIKVAVERLRAADNRWHAVEANGCTTLTLAWADAVDTVDTLLLLSPDTAFGLREDAQGRRHWAMRGTLPQVVGHAARLAAPDSSDAPKATGSDALPRAEWR